MRIRINTRPNGQHLVRLAPRDLVVVDPEGEVPLAGRTTSRDERVAIFGAVQAHKALCWSRGYCLEHEVQR